MYYYLLTITVCFCTGYIPSVSTEVFLASIGLMIPSKHILPLAFAGAISQTVAKTHLYFLANKFVRCLKFKTKRKLVKLKQHYQTRQKMGMGIVFISSLTGLPPYYLINLLCGLLKTGWKSFAVTGLVGMFIRFSFCLAFPHCIMKLFH